MIRLIASLLLVGPVAFMALVVAWEIAVMPLEATRVQYGARLITDWFPLSIASMLSGIALISGDKSE